MNGDYLLAERLVEIFRKESREVSVPTAQRCSYKRIAKSIQRLLKEHNPPAKKPKERDL